MGVAVAGLCGLVVLWLWAGYAGGPAAVAGPLAGLVVLAVLLRAAHDLRDALRRARTPRPPRLSAWFRVHPAFGLHPVPEPRDFPAGESMFGDAWLLMDATTRDDIELRFFAVVLESLVEPGTTFTARLDDRRVAASVRLTLGLPRLAGPLTTDAVRALVHAGPTRLRVCRGDATLLDVFGDWTGANIALGGHERARLVRRMSEVGFDVAPA